MTHVSQNTGDVRLIGWLERKNDDFPYYTGHPVALSALQWVAVVLAVGVGFAALIATQPIFPTGLAGFIPAILYVAVPLGMLALVAGGHRTALFRRIRRIDLLWILVFFLLNAVVTLAVGFFVVHFFATSVNPAGDILVSATATERVLFFFKSAIQLLGEEIFTILPFLALMTLFVSYFGLSRTPAIILAALCVSTIFALIHLPTYQWHYAQAIIGLVPVRLVLLMPYIITKNIWVSTGVHIVNDWVIFGLPILATAYAA